MFYIKEICHDVDCERRGGIGEFGVYQDAAVRAPVIDTQNGRPRTVLRAYEDHLRPVKRHRWVGTTVAISWLAGLEASTMEPGLDYFNANC